MMRRQVHKWLTLVALMAAGGMRGNSQTSQLLIQTTAWYRAETTVPKLPGLTIVDCIMVLNCKTHYQVNLEVRDYDYREPKYELDLIALTNRPIQEVVSNLLNQNRDYVFVKTDDAINVIPKDRLDDSGYVFNAVIPNYEVSDQNLVGAFEPLYRSFPQVALFFPVMAAIDSKPKWIADEKADTRAGPKFSLRLQNAKLRDVLNRIARKSEDSFWVAQHSIENPPKWYWISIYRRDYGVKVLWEHDPGLREQIRHYKEGK